MNLRNAVRSEDTEDHSHQLGGMEQAEVSGIEVAASLPEWRQQESHGGGQIQADGRQGRGE